MIKKQTIEDFQKVAIEETGRKLSFDEAEEILKTWINYFNLLAKLNHRENQSDKNNNDI